MFQLANDVTGPEQGYWIYEDYAAIPDDGGRYEVISGVLVHMEQNTSAHQRMVGRGIELLYPLLKRNLYLSPLDVELSLDTVVQPDPFVLHRDVGKEESHIKGIPDVAIEVSTPETALYDRLVKLPLYQRFNVPEIWIIDIEAQSILMYQSIDDEYIHDTYEDDEYLPSLIEKLNDLHVKQFFL